MRRRAILKAAIITGICRACSGLDSFGADV
jgi:hypothetical protein